MDSSLRQWFKGDDDYYWPINIIVDDATGRIFRGFVDTGSAEANQYGRL
jgi:hypothetical protein